MFAFFKKREAGFSDNRYYLLAQDKWAKKMTALTRDLSRDRLVLLLILFVVLTLSMLIGVLVYGVDSKGLGKSPVGSISKLVAPEKKSTTLIPLGDSISKRQEERLFEYKLYLEYLDKKVKRKASRESIQNIEVEPDNALIENDYKSNFKK
jgi:hypothetical protein